MLIISEEQFLAELKDTIPSSQPKVVDIESPNIVNEVIMENHTYDNFRKPEGPNTPKEVKALIGALATETSQKEVAEAFPVSLTTIANLENDNHSNTKVKEVKESIIEKIQAKSLDKIDKCIEFLDISKDLAPNKLIHIAEGLSRIHEKLTPKTPPENSITQFIYYIPESQRKIEDYEVIDAG